MSRLLPAGIISLQKVEDSVRSPREQTAARHRHHFDNDFRHGPPPRAASAEAGKPSSVPHIAALIQLAR